jgi:hypothetical protein
MIIGQLIKFFYSKTSYVFLFKKNLAYYLKAERNKKRLKYITLFEARLSNFVITRKHRIYGRSVRRNKKEKLCLTV